MHFKILVVFSDYKEGLLLAERLYAYSCDIAAVLRPEENILKVALETRPNIILMDSFLPTVNCDDIAGELEREYPFPLVKIAKSKCPNDILASRFYGKGGDLFLIEPLELKALLHKMEEYLYMRVRETRSGSMNTRIRNEVKHELLRLRTPITSVGFYYLIDSITLTVQSPSLLNRLVSELYPTVAKMHRCPPNNVERCIRTSVEQTFDRGNINLLYPLFKDVIRPKTGRPTNGDFIAMLTDLVHDRLGLYR